IFFVGREQVLLQVVQSSSCSELFAVNLVESLVSLVSPIGHSDKVMRVEKKIAAQRVRRRHHVRNAVRSSGRLRLTVFRSNRNISAQIIDDETGRTLVSASTLEKELGGAGAPHGNVAAAKKVGFALGERAIKAGITEV